MVCIDIGCLVDGVLILISWLFDCFESLLLFDCIYCLWLLDCYYLVGCFNSRAEDCIIFYYVLLIDYLAMMLVLFIAVCLLVCG